MAKLSWDSNLPSGLPEIWLKFRDSLISLERVRISRWLGISETSIPTFHEFRDASTKAYAAVVYKECIDLNGESHFILVAAIPRLELSAAQLLTTLMYNVRRALRLEDATCNLWRDSTIVFHWIRRHPASLKQFVANRVAYIQSKSDSGTWRHIISEFNPADCASRGITASEIENNLLWWGGPTLFHQVEKALSELPDLTNDEQQVFIIESRALNIFLGVGVEARLLMTSFGTLRIPLVERFCRLEALLNTNARI
ncbi:PREDICTED: uncharacterized protein LOC108363438 [Rhagoletis zephyria]|uniref:uncharacterized protein LOC108363438 n=1 Tax=Rhagoletis zephyria TaxID=28612 RepID=UPI0008112649|nr:PREDICTED: uncharacterized protein LOC108363438 [Rhagoletis zephyria]